MQKLTCLFLEDKDTDFSKFSGIISLALDTFEVIFERAKDPWEACSKLRERGTDFQIMFADLLMRDSTVDAEEIAEGLQAVEVAVHVPNLVVVGLSNAASSHPEVRKKFDYLGGHLYLDKRDVQKSNYSLQELKTAIVGVLAKHGVGIAEDHKFELNWREGDDLRLDAELDTIGNENLLGVLHQIEQMAQRFKPAYVAPGFSGAAVLRVDVQDDKGRSTQQLLVKLSRDADKLKLELDRAPIVGAPSTDRYVSYRQAGPWQFNGWGAIAAQFQGSATTLLEALLSDHALNHLPELLDELFEHLRGAYNLGNAVSSSALKELTPSLQGRARILLSTQNTTTKLIRKCECEFDPLFIERFLKHWQIADHPASSMPQGSFVCMSHGDLHTRNILVTQKHPRLWLIDTGLRRTCHWATDIARLCADLWVSAWDGGEASHFWDKLPEWRQNVLTWSLAQPISLDASTSNASTLAALVWLREQVHYIFQGLCLPDVPQWEYKLALAMEFLSMSAYGTNPAPKRCLALLSAHDILKQIEHEIPWGGGYS